MPALLVIGAVTRDRIDGRDVPGGVASYAARAAAALGVRAAILTVAAADADLAALAGHDVVVVPADATLTFAHARAANGERALTLLARPGRALTWDDLPARWRAADALLLAPLLPDDIDIASFARVEAPLRGLLAQGLQRAVAADGRVSTLHAPSPALLDACTTDTTVFLSAEETRAWTDGDREAVAVRCARLVVTEGARGATVYAGGSARTVPPAPATAVDATGAGDVFATAFILGLEASSAAGLGNGDAAAGRLASALAAASVEHRGPAPLPTRAELEQRWPRTSAGADVGASEAETGQR